LLRDIPYKHEVIAAAVVLIGKEQFEIIARNDAARALNAMPSGHDVVIIGRLTSERWQTAGGIWQTKVQIIAETVEGNDQTT